MRAILYKLDYEVTYDWATYETYVDYYLDLLEDMGDYIVSLMLPCRVSRRTW